MFISYSRERERGGGEIERHHLAGLALMSSLNKGVMQGFLEYYVMEALYSWWTGRILLIRVEGLLEGGSLS